MSQRHIHYEAAFEDYLRSLGVPYVAVDEAKKALFGKAKLKSFDFIVYGSDGPNMLIDVKGRKFPYDLKGARRYWENWVTGEDIDGLTQWESVFGGGFAAMFVFAYWLVGPDAVCPVEEIHEFRGQRYWFVGITLEEYRPNMRIRSPKWNTVCLPRAEFRRLIRPMAGIIAP